MSSLVIYYIYTQVVEMWNPMNNIEKIFRTIEEIEKRKCFFFGVWPLTDGRIGLDVMDYKDEDKVDGGIFKSAPELLAFLEEHYV